MIQTALSFHLSILSTAGTRPFFYSSYEVYYGMGYAESSNDQFNNLVAEEWDGYLEHQVAASHLNYLLFKATPAGIDSVERYARGTLKVPPNGYADSDTSKLTGTKAQHFLNYLRLDRACERFAVNDKWDTWDTVKRQHSEPDLEPRLLMAFKAASDAFIRQRLWFQLVRYYYFSPDSLLKNKAVIIFEQYKAQFPQNLLWYRSLGYLAGFYYARKDYARANYYYSRCYDFSNNLKIPSFWSFHPQEEKDWKQTLALARNKKEVITLWQMLGIDYDAGRAIRAIATIDPRSEKLDLLLSRLINIREGGAEQVRPTDSVIQNSADDKRIVEELAKQGKTAKPYFWNLAAGYLNYLDSNYTAAAKYYAIAKTQYPASDTLVVAQSKVLDILLQVSSLKKINANAEMQLTEPLNWLADLRDHKANIEHLRFGNALDDCTERIAHLYDKQNEKIKALSFRDSLSGSVYQDSSQTEALIHFLNKPRHTAFEKAMLRYYPHKVNDLYYHQALRLAYSEQTKAAIAYLKKRPGKDFELEGNPFNGRLVDCHDCDHTAPQKQTYTPLRFLQTLESVQEAIRQGKNVYRNALLAANAYYNITYYGNGRAFYEADLVSGHSDSYNPDSLDDDYLSMDIATKYYQLARRKAVTPEQKARCTFMLAKCMLDGSYSYGGYTEASPPYLIHQNTNHTTFTGRYQSYFRQLKTLYNHTAYYREALRECGYFKSYVLQPVRKSKWGK